MFSILKNLISGVKEVALRKRLADSFKEQDKRLKECQKKVKQHKKEAVERTKSVGKTTEKTV